MLCDELTLVNANDFRGTLISLPCRRWTCSHCQQTNRKKVIRAAAAGAPNVFLTLTCDPKNYSDPDEAARDMKRGLVALRRRIERRYGVKNVPFVVVFERTKKGWPHMHALLRAPYLPQRELSEMWAQITGAFVVDIRFIKKKSQVLFYVTKYLGKDLAAFKGCKRWWRSHNYGKPEKREYVRPAWADETWVVREPLAKVRANLAAWGWRIQKDGDGGLMAFRPDGRSWAGWKRDFAFDHVSGALEWAAL